MESWDGMVRMLILSRKPGDAILIDGGIRIVVLASGQRSVRLGIEAPDEIGIVREEIASRGNGQAKPADAANDEATRPATPLSPPIPAEGDEAARPPEG